MKERPILFSAPMVRALLDGRKTQTRRAMKPQPAKKGRWTEWCHNGVLVTDQNVAWQPFETGFPLALSNPGLGWLCPYGQRGDRLWVRETTLDVEEHGYLGPVYVESEEGRACIDGGLAPDPEDMAEVDPWEIKRRPSTFMPRAMSRILLEVTDVRVERLQDISEADCIAEGMSPGCPDDEDARHMYSPRCAYEMLWNQINGLNAWDANPWIWAVSFKRATS